MKVDLHCHCKFSHDNYLNPEDLIREVIKNHLDGVTVICLLNSKIHNPQSEFCNRKGGP